MKLRERVMENFAKQFRQLMPRRHPIAPKSFKLLFVTFVLGWLGFASSTATVMAETGQSARVIDTKFFGMHIHHLDVPYPNGQRSAWPSVPIGGWRLVGTYTNWYELERAKGKWDFSRLDRYIALAEQKGVPVLLTLGRTPRWASARPNELCMANFYGCAAEPKDMQDWANYVRTVATRYKGRISTYEIWNEPAFSEIEATVENGMPTHFFTGSAAKMIEMSRIAYTTLKEIDSAIVVVSPSVTDAGNGLRRLETFLKLGGAKWADVIGYHYYVSPPEVTVSLTAGLRAILHAHGLSDKPIWNTEMGYTFSRIDLGILPSPPKGDFRDVLDYWTGAGYVARALILAAANGIDRVYWFNWDGEPPHPTMGLAGFAGRNPTTMTMTYKTVYDWLVGSSVKDCNRNSAGVWSCSIEQGLRKGVLVWAEKGSAVWNPVGFPNAVAYEQVGRADVAVSQSQGIPVNTLPILVKAEPLRWKK